MSLGGVQALYLPPPALYCVSFSLSVLFLYICVLASPIPQSIVALKPPLVRLRGNPPFEISYLHLPTPLRCVVRSGRKTLEPVSLLYVCPPFLISLTRASGTPYLQVARSVVVRARRSLSHCKFGVFFYQPQLSMHPQKSWIFPFMIRLRGAEKAHRGIFFILYPSWRSPNISPLSSYRP